MTETVTINGEEWDVVSFNEDHIKLYNEVVEIGKVIRIDEFKLGLLKSRYDDVLQTLEYSLKTAKEEGPKE